MKTHWESRLQLLEVIDLCCPLNAEVGCIFVAKVHFFSHCVLIILSVNLALVEETSRLDRDRLRQESILRLHMRTHHGTTHLLVVQNWRVFQGHWMFLLLYILLSARLSCNILLTLGIHE